MYLKEQGSERSLGKLANFTINRDAMPLKVEDGSAQVPSFTTVLAGLPEYTDDYIGKDVLLGLGGPSSYLGKVINYTQSDDSGAIALDCATVLQKLNTEQTALPYFSIAPQHERLIAYWMQQCGLFKYQTYGDVQSYAGENDIMYLKDQTTKLYSEGFKYQTPAIAIIPLAPVKSWKDPYNLGAKAEPTAFYPGKPILFSAFNVYGGGDAGRDWAVEWSFVPMGTSAVPTKLSIKVSGGFVTLRERVGDTNGTVIGTLAASDTLTRQSKVYVLAQPNATNPALTDFRIRVTYVGYDAAAAVTSPVLTSTSILTKEPAQTALGYMQNTGTVYDPYASFAAYISYASELPSTAGKTLVDGYLYAGEIADIYPVKVAGFTGNVWEKIKQFCAIYNYDFQVLEDGRVKITHRINPGAYNNATAEEMVQRSVIKSNVRKQITSRETARYVDVVVDKYDLNPTSDPSKLNDKLMWKADSVYTLEKGENRVETVQTDSTFIALDQPIPWNGAPVPFSWSTGIYVITGADGYIVDDHWWTNNGGSIKVRATDKSGEIEIEFQAPNIDTARAPYRVSEGAADRPALYITGIGMRKTPETIRVSTGAPYAGQEVGATIDTGFITNDAIAYRVGAMMANHYSGENVELSFNTPVQTPPQYDTGAPDTGLGYVPEGKVVYHNGSSFRVSSTQQTPKQLSVSKAEQYDPIFLVDFDMDALTVDQYDAIHTTETVNDVDRAPLKKYIG